MKVKPKGKCKQYILSILQSKYSRCCAGLHVYVGGCVNRQLKINFPCVQLHKWTVNVCCTGRVYTQVDTLTIRFCYYTHRALIFNGRLMNPPAYKYTPAQYLDHLLF